MKEDKLRELRNAVAVIERQFGKGAVTGPDGAPAEEIAVIPTGWSALDKALGVGGFPRGRVVEIFGTESAITLSLVLRAVAQAQKTNEACAFVDAEHALDPARAQRIGVVLGDMLIAQPDCGEQALEIADQLARTGAVDLLVIDSVGALTPRAEIDGDADAQEGLHARLMSQALRKLTAVAFKTDTCIVFVNHLQQKRSGPLFGVFDHPAGNALKFYASVRLDVRRIGEASSDEKSARVRVKAVKNKCAPPFRDAEIDVDY